MDSIANPNMKIMEEGVGAHSLVCRTSGVKRCAKAPKSGLGRLTSKLIIHTNIHKPNNKLFSV
jgi:hypothetical protein